MLIAPYLPRTPAATIAGIDEAGRGPLAGPLLVAAVVLDPHCYPDGLNDSKKLSARQRERLYHEIRAQALQISVVEISSADIDRLNIFQATLEGMRRAVMQLQPPPACALIDGNRIPPGLGCPAEALVGGDALEPAISAASIIAKVTRDRFMQSLHVQYPGYGFDRHMGYPTPLHLQQLRQLGPCPQHRRSYAPVRQAMLDRH